MIPPWVHGSEAAFDGEENEVRGTLVFKPPVEILPKTRRTEEMQRKKLVPGWKTTATAWWVEFSLRSYKKPWKTDH